MAARQLDELPGLTLIDQAFFRFLLPPAFLACAAKERWGRQRASTGAHAAQMGITCALAALAATRLAIKADAAIWTKRRRNGDRRRSLRFTRASHLPSYELVGFIHVRFVASIVLRQEKLWGPLQLE